MNLDLFAPAFTQPAGSPIRELFPFLSRPGMISFAGGYPSPQLFDAEGLQQAAAKVMQDGAKALQYGATEGAPALRQALATLSATRGVEATPADVLVTTGSQAAFDLLVRIFVKPGDVVFVEAPAYPATLQALRLAGAAIREVPVDAEGLDTARLEAMLRDERPKLLYTVPTFSNPCGTLLPTHRREALVRLAIQHGFLIVEDDPYGELSFDGDTPQPLHAHGRAQAGADNPVLYLSSLSKTVAPALRIGWMVANAEVLRRCAVAKQVVDLCTSPINQLIAAEYLDAGRYAPAVQAMRTEYRHRMRAMAQGLQSTLGERARFVRPAGGMFIWLELLTDADPKRVFDAAVEAGVLFVPGHAFHVEAQRSNAMRLSYAAPGIDDIREGVRRLGAALDAA